MVVIAVIRRVAMAAELGLTAVIPPGTSPPSENLQTTVTSRLRWPCMSPSDFKSQGTNMLRLSACLLYTSDAADD